VEPGKSKKKAVGEEELDSDDDRIYTKVLLYFK